MNESKTEKMKYFACQVEEAMDLLWDEGKWDNQKNEAVLKEYLRTPYHEN